MRSKLILKIKRTSNLQTPKSRRSRIVLRNIKKVTTLKSGRTITLLAVVTKFTEFLS